jgi:AcrR family transcriptional regulator
MSRTRSAAYEDQREMILARAAQLFADRGYPGTSMNEVARACGLSKATLYYYYKDKFSLLAHIVEAHVIRLHALLDEVHRSELTPAARLRELIRRFVEEYAGAQHAHRVLTESVRFLEATDRGRVLGIERELVAGTARIVTALRPDLVGARMDKPLTMLLFGMINWMFTWMKPGGDLDHADIAIVVGDLFLGGLPAVQAIEVSGQANAKRSRGALE